MRKLAAAFLIFVAIVAAGSIWTRDTGADAAYAEAGALIEQAISRGDRVLRFDDLHALRDIPPRIAGLDGLIQLSLRNTGVSDIGDLAGLAKLQVLNLRGTRITDLGAVAGLPELEILDIGETWVADLSPLVSLPRLKRLDVGGTQLRTLEPATRMAELNWINLHGAYAIDGSQDHYEALKSAGVKVNNGRAMSENHRPDWIDRSKVRLQRAGARLGLAADGR